MVQSLIFEQILQKNSNFEVKTARFDHFLQISEDSAFSCRKGTKPRLKNDRYGLSIAKN